MQMTTEALLHYQPGQDRRPRVLVEETIKAFPKDVCMVNMIFRRFESKHAQKQVLKEVYALLPSVPQ